MTEHRTPHFGHTATGAPVHRETRHYRLPHVHETPTTRWRRFRLRKQHFDAGLGLWITEKVGTMNCAYLFALLALLSLPSILSAFAAFHGVFPNWAIRASIIALIAWIAQTFFQLVLLPIIIVGQNIQAKASDARAEKTFNDTEAILEWQNLEIEGGAQVIIEKLDRLLEPPKTKTRGARATGT